MTGYTTGDDNRIDRDGTYEYQYDAEGNLYRRVTLAMTEGGLLAIGATTEYGYDHRNRLGRVTESFTPGGTPSKWTEYSYDAFDRRVAKVLNSNGAGNPERYEFYIWDGDDVVLDFVDADGGASPAASLDRRYLHGAAVDQILAQETAGNTVRWMLADHQGTVRDLVDNAGALAGDHVVFDSFGKITSGTLGTRFSYTGQEYDPDTGLYYYNARWYDPKSGRFLTKDPTGFAAGDTNQYRYVGNNAANLIDPSGLATLQLGVSCDVTIPLQLYVWPGPAIHIQGDLSVFLGISTQSDPFVTVGVGPSIGVQPAIGSGASAGVTGGFTTGRNVGALNGASRTIGVNTPAGGINGVSSAPSTPPLDTYKGGTVSPGAGRIGDIHCGKVTSYIAHTGTAGAPPPTWVWPWDSSASWNPADTLQLWFGF